MIQDALSRWTVADLAPTFPLTYQGTTYALPRQWILWRILAHDLHHGGELAVTLGMQGMALPELGDQGGHLSAAPVAKVRYFDASYFALDENANAIAEAIVETFTS